METDAHPLQLLDKLNSVGDVARKMAGVLVEILRLAASRALIFTYPAVSRTENTEN